MTWPKAVQERVKTGHDRELVHSYPYRSACPSTVWVDLVECARGEHAGGVVDGSGAAGVWIRLAAWMPE